MDSDLSEITTAELRELAKSSGTGNVELDGYIVMHLTASEDVTYKPLVTVKTFKPLSITLEGQSELSFTAGEADSETFTVWANNVLGTAKWTHNEDELLMQDIDVVISNISKDATTQGLRVYVGTSHRSIAGSYKLTFTVDDDRNAGYSTERTKEVYIYIEAAETAALELSAGSTEPARSGSSVRVPLTLTGGSGTATWTVSGTSGIGVTLGSQTTTGSTSNNSVAVTVPNGTPEGTYSFTVNVTDNTTGLSTSETVSVTVDNGIVGPDIPIPPTSEISIAPEEETISVNEDEDFSISFAAFGNNDVVSWRITSDAWNDIEDIPLNLKIDSRGEEATLTGHAPVVDKDTEYTFNVTAMDSESNATAKVTVMVINTDGEEPYNPIDDRNIPNLSSRPLVLTAAIADNIRAALGDELPEGVRTLSESNIGSAMEPDNNTATAMLDAGYQLAGNINTLTVSEDGYYAFTFTLPAGYVGMNMSDLSVFAKTVSVRTAALGVKASAVGDVSKGWLLDNNGNKSDKATQEVIAIAHVEANSSAGTYFGSKVIPSAGLDELAITTVEITDTMRENFVQSLSADMTADEARSIRSVSEENIYSPVEPSQATIDEIKEEDNFELAYKLNSIQVDERGYYAFNINIPSELLHYNASDVKVYVINQNAVAGSSFKPSVIPGALSVFELDALGLKLDSLGEKILAVGLLNAGTPFSVYLGKLILMLLMGGCQVSFSGMGMIALAGAVLILGGARLLKRR